MERWRKVLEDEAKKAVAEIEKEEPLTAEERIDGINLYIVNELLNCLKEKYEDAIKTDLESDELKILDLIHQL